MSKDDTIVKTEAEIREEAARATASDASAAPPSPYVFEFGDGAGSTIQGFDSKAGDIQVTASYDYSIFKNKDDFTRAELAQNDEFIRAATVYYNMKYDRMPEMEGAEGVPQGKGMSAEELTEWTMDSIRYAGLNTFGIYSAVSDLNSAQAGEVEAFEFLKEAYENKEWTFEGLGKGIAGAVLDPINIIGLGAGGAAIKAGVIKWGGSKMVAGAAAGAVIGAPTGAITAVAHSPGIQTLNYHIGEQDERFKWSSFWKDVGFGTVAGTGGGLILGGMGGKIASTSIGQQISAKFSRTADNTANLDTSAPMNNSATLDTAAPDGPALNSNITREAGTQSAQADAAKARQTAMREANKQSEAPQQEFQLGQARDGRSPEPGGTPSRSNSGDAPRPASEFAPRPRTPRTPRDTPESVADALARGVGEDMSPAAIAQRAEARGDGFRLKSGETEVEVTPSGGGARAPSRGADGATERASADAGRAADDAGRSADDAADVSAGRAADDAADANANRAAEDTVDANANRAAEDAVDANANRAADDAADDVADVSAGRAADDTVDANANRAADDVTDVADDTVDATRSTTSSTLTTPINNIMPADKSDSVTNWVGRLHRFTPDRIRKFADSSHYIPNDHFIARKIRPLLRHVDTALDDNGLIKPIKDLQASMDVISKRLNGTRSPAISADDARIEMRQLLTDFRDTHGQKVTQLNSSLNDAIKEVRSQYTYSTTGTKKDSQGNVVAKAQKQIGFRPSQKKAALNFLSDLNERITDLTDPASLDRIIEPSANKANLARSLSEEMFHLGQMVDGVKLRLDAQRTNNYYDWDIYARNKIPEGTTSAALMRNEREIITGFHAKETAPLPKVGDAEENSEAWVYGELWNFAEKYTKDGVISFDVQAASAFATVVKDVIDYGEIPTLMQGLQNLVWLKGVGRIQTFPDDFVEKFRTLGSGSYWDEVTEGLDSIRSFIGHGTKKGSNRDILREYAKFMQEPITLRAYVAPNSWMSAPMKEDIDFFISEGWWKRSLAHLGGGYTTVGKDADKRKVMTMHFPWKGEEIDGKTSIFRKPIIRAPFNILTAPAYPFYRLGKEAWNFNVMGATPVKNWAYTLGTIGAISTGGVLGLEAYTGEKIDPFGLEISAVTSGVIDAGIFLADNTIIGGARAGAAVLENIPFINTTLENIPYIGGDGIYGTRLNARDLSIGNNLDDLKAWYSGNATPSRAPLLKDDGSEMTHDEAIAALEAKREAILPKRDEAKIEFETLERISKTDGASKADQKNTDEAQDTLDDLQNDIEEINENLRAVSLDRAKDLSMQQTQGITDRLEQVQTKGAMLRLYNLGLDRNYNVQVDLADERYFKAAEALAAQDTDYTDADLIAAFNVLHPETKPAKDSAKKAAIEAEKEAEKAAKDAEAARIAAEKAKNDDDGGDTPDGGGVVAPLPTLPEDPTFLDLLGVQNTATPPAGGGGGGSPHIPQNTRARTPLADMMNQAASGSGSGSSKFWGGLRQMATAPFDWDGDRKAPDAIEGLFNMISGGRTVGFGAAQKAMNGDIKNGGMWFGIGGAVLAFMGLSRLLNDSPKPPKNNWFGLKLPIMIAAAAMMGKLIYSHFSKDGQSTSAVASAMRSRAMGESMVAQGAGLHRMNGMNTTVQRTHVNTPVVLKAVTGISAKEDSGIFSLQLSRKDGTSFAPTKFRNLAGGDASQVAAALSQARNDNMYIPKSDLPPEMDEAREWKHDAITTSEGHKFIIMEKIGNSANDPKQFMAVELNG